MDLRLAGFSAEALEGGRILEHPSLGKFREERSHFPHESPCSFWEHLFKKKILGAFGFGKPLPKRKYSWYFVRNVSRQVI